MWRGSYKKFMRFPRNISNCILDTFFEKTMNTSTIMWKNNISRINERFDFEYPDFDEVEDYN